MAHIASVYLLETPRSHSAFSVIQLAVVATGMAQIVIGGRILGRALIGWFLGLLVYGTLLAMLLRLGLTPEYRTFFTNSIVMVCFIQLVSSPQRLKLALFSVGAAGAVASGLLVRQVDVGSLAGADLSLAWSFRGGSDLPGGNPNIAGMYLAIAFVICAGAVVTGGRSGRLRAGMGLLALVNVVGVAATGSRNALLFCAIGALILIGLTKRRLVPIAALLVWVAYYAVENVRALYVLIGHRFVGLGGTLGSDELRVEVAREAIAAITDRPFGVGIGLSRQYLNELVYTHSNYLELLLSLGVIGGIYFYAFYARMALRLWRAPTDLSVILLAALIALSCYEIFQVTYLYKGPLLLLTLIVAHSEVYFPVGKDSETLKQGSFSGTEASPIGATTVKMHRVDLRSRHRRTGHRV